MCHDNPDARKLLHRLHWFSIKHSVLIDLEDSTKAKHISPRKSSTSKVQLCDTSCLRTQIQNSQFHVFSSARFRRKVISLQASAASFISQTQYPIEYFLWSDGAYSRFNPFSSAVTLVTLNNQVCHNSAVTLNTDNSAIAEICGVIHNFNWLLTRDDRPSSVHIMCDNQYTIKVCLKLIKPHPSHAIYFKLLNEH